MRQLTHGPTPRGCLCWWRLSVAPLMVPVLVKAFRDLLSNATIHTRHERSRYEWHVVTGGSIIQFAPVGRHPLVRMRAVRYQRGFRMSTEVPWGGGPARKVPQGHHWG